jgi:tripartite-type tricarboxylate transporter receptor subunit TctC
MKLTRRALAGLAAGLATPALAQDNWPNRPVRIVIPFIPGSAPDINARQIADQLGQRIGQPVVAENRPGAAGNIGFTYVAKQAQPDGYTLLWGTGSLSVNTALYARVEFDAINDFTPIALPFSMSNVVTVRADSPITDIPGLIARLRADPRTPYASGGFGSAAHLTVALFLSRSGTEAEHIPFRGAPDIINAVRAGTVVFGMPQTQVALPLIRAGQLRALAVTARNPGAGGVDPGLRLLLLDGRAGPGAAAGTDRRQGGGRRAGCAARPGLRQPRDGGRDDADRARRGAVPRLPAQRPAARAGGGPDFRRADRVGATGPAPRPVPAAPTPCRGRAGGWGGAPRARARGSSRRSRSRRRAGRGRRHPPASPRAAAR